MARTQYYLAQSLDGYLADDDDSLEWLTGFAGVSAPEGSVPIDGTYESFYDDVGAVAMGSGTYEWLLENSPDSWHYEGKPAWVFSSRELADPYSADPPIRFVSAPVEELHGEMAEAAGDRNLWVVGGGVLASQFAAAGLLDELILTVVPVVLGSGRPTFAEPIGAPMRPTAVRTFTNGMTELRFELSG